jgi:Flp pilus assembly protein TadD
MKTSMKTIAAVCSAGALAGCAGNQKTAETTIVPAMKVQHSYESADGYYTLGRYYHGARRYEEALKAYRHALSLESGHTKAANAMAVLHAERGDFQTANDMLRQLVEAAPDAAHLLSNLGHVYFLKGDYQSALPILEKATALDPTNARAWSNLGSTLEKLGDTSGAQRVFARTQDVEHGRPLRATDRVVGTVSVLASKVSRAVTAPAEIGARTEISKVGPNIYEVQNVGIVPVERNALSDANKARLSVPVRVEVSNGNGIHGMAKAVGKLIERGELKVVRLTNQSRFAVSTTRVEYKDGFEKSAYEIAEGFGQPAMVKLENTGGFNVDVRVVLGKDLPNTGAIRTQYMERRNGALQARASVD